MEQVERAAPPARQLGDQDGIKLTSLRQRHDLAALNAIRLGARTGSLFHADSHSAPIFERTDDGIVLAGPWCMGFLAAMKLRYADWAALRDRSRIEHRLLSPILLHCMDGIGRSILGPVRAGPEGEAFLHTACHDIPIVVPAIRAFWMPQHARS